MSASFFPGQQSDEKILYEVKPHQLALYIRIGVLIFTAGIIIILSLFLSTIHTSLMLFGLCLSIIIGFFGSWITIIQHQKTIAYITDRRMVRFEAHNPFHVSTRSLSWDDTMKIKTYPPNILWSLLNIGTIVLHARSSIVSFTHDDIQREVSGDDLELKDIWYYKDLGNYLDKILYTNKRNPQDLETFRPFIPKPAGQRY